jgi:WhiB family redox-sensing transcriptional regulator
MTLDWRHRAACRNKDPELMFPFAEPGTKIYDWQVDEAKAVCARCPVTSECLAFALSEGMEHGVWGGVDAVERRALSLRQAR